MSRKHLMLKPHRTKDPNWWWHEENWGMCIVHKAESSGISEILIPWREIRAALARKDQSDEAKETP